ncbi:MAG: MFS transporter, partial [Acidobacteriota bacterium]
MATHPASLPANPNDTAFFGHPRGLSTLFFTEMWERFSYYGIRALLILYMTATVEQHGLGLGVAVAGALYGLYTSCAYIFALPSGWIADRFLGHQNSVIFGGLLIAAGNFGLMLPS